MDFREVDSSINPGCYNLSMHVYLNGRILPAKEASVSVFDHGFLYGDGIYETMRVYEGVVFKINEHISRLYRSASLIGLRIPYNTEGIKAAICETLIANGFRNAYMRITVSRGRGDIGLDPDLCPEPTVMIISRELREYPPEYYKKGISVIIAKTRRNLREAIDPRIKSLNFLNNILAKIEAKKLGAYEAIMLNVNKKLAEGTISNVFFTIDGMLCTPSVSCGILDGITRGIVIGLAKKQGIRVKEGKFTKEDLYCAEEVFITNTTMEVMPVSGVDDREYGVGSTAKLLRRLYRAEVNAYAADIRSRGPSIWGLND
jgi:branched-chain amino acid aminotransferase